MAYQNTFQNAPTGLLLSLLANADLIQPEHVTVTKLQSDNDSNVGLSFAQPINADSVQSVQVTAPQLPSGNSSKAKIACQLALSRFDELPASAFVRLPVVLGLFPCSRATFWRWVKSSKAPSPKKICGGRVSAWNVGELRLALEEILTSGSVAKNAVHPKASVKKGGCNE